MDKELSKVAKEEIVEVIFFSQRLMPLLGGGGNNTKDQSREKEARNSRSIWRGRCNNTQDQS